jgi:dephospho-CoA kinase
MTDARNNKRKKLLVGITGAVGAGKSTVCRVLRSAGYPVLSADEFARVVSAKGSDSLKKIQQIFGKESLTSEGELDRSLIRKKILEDPTLRKKLEAITHPEIQKLSQKAAETLFEQGADIVFYEAPLLFEAGSDKKMDAVICVYAEESKLIERVMKRDGVDKTHAEKLLAAQMPQAEKLKRSSHSIRNDAGEAELEKSVEDILAEFKKTLAS